MKHTKYILIISLVFFGFTSTALAASYPKNFSISINNSTKVITLNGTGVYNGKDTAIQLPAKATSIQAEKINKSNTRYLVVLYKSGTKLRFRLYHPNGNKLDSKLINERKSQQSFSNIELAIVDSKARVRAIKQTKNEKNKYFIFKRYKITPNKTKKVTIDKSSTSTIEKPTNEDPLDLINYYRKITGFMPVTEKKSLTNGCKKHVEYMILNNELTHYEYEGRPGYTEEGAAAGLASDLSVGRLSMSTAIQGWIDTLYHRLPMLHSNWEQAGFYYDSESRFACLQGWSVYSTLIDYDEPIAMPTPKMTNVPTSFQGNETPDPLTDQDGTYPSGTVITLSFSYGTDISKMTVTLKDSQGNKISGYKRLPNDDSDPNEAHQRSTVSFIPKSPLNTNSTYTVKMKGTVDGDSFSKTWDFTTGNE